MTQHEKGAPIEKDAGLSRDVTFNLSKWVDGWNSMRKGKYSCE